MPAWSPGGKRIAFIWPDWPASSLWVMRPDGTGRWLVADPPDDQTSLLAPAWSPDGQRLAFCVGMAADTGAQAGELAIVSPMSMLTRLSAANYHPPNRQGGLMYEIFTYGRFEVEPENEEAFVEAWSEFAAWISQRPGNQSVRLTRDVRNTGRLVSVSF